MNHESNLKYTKYFKVGDFAKIWTVSLCENPYRWMTLIGTLERSPHNNLEPHLRPRGKILVMAHFTVGLGAEISAAAG